MASIAYIFAFQDASEVRFDVEIERASSPQAEREDLPAWTELSFHQCATCPLAGPGRCPPAVDAFEILQHFGDRFSFERADVRVLMPQREVRKSTDVQTALQSLLGVVMATSGCPVLGRLRGMAELHLPFASTRETVYRTCGHHLLRQYFIEREGGRPDWELVELRAFYEELQEVNAAFVERIRAAATRDANLNALVNLFAVSVLVTFSLDEELADLASLFS